MPAATSKVSSKTVPPGHESAKKERIGAGFAVAPQKATVRATEGSALSYEDGRQERKRDPAGEPCDYEAFSMGPPELSDTKPCRASAGRLHRLRNRFGVTVSPPVSWEG